MYNCSRRHPMEDTTHYHIWLYGRDADGVIRSMQRDEATFPTRRKANYALEMFRRQQAIAGQVLKCVDEAFCAPPPDWLVLGPTLGGPREVTAEYFIEDTPSIRPVRKLQLGMARLAKYTEEHPDDVLREPGGPTKEWPGWAKRYQSDSS